MAPACWEPSARLEISGNLNSSVMSKTYKRNDILVGAAAFAISVSFFLCFLSKPHCQAALQCLIWPVFTPEILRFVGKQVQYYEAVLDLD